MATTTKPAERPKESVASVNARINNAMVAKFLEWVEGGGGLAWDKGHNGESMRRPVNIATGVEYTGSNAFFLGMAAPFNSKRWITGKQLEDLAAKMRREGVPEDKLPRIKLLDPPQQVVNKKGKPRFDEQGAPIMATMAPTMGVYCKQYFSKPKDGKDEAEEGEGAKSGARMMTSTFWVYNADQIENCPGVSQGMERAFEPIASGEQLMAAMQTEIGPNRKALKVIFGQGNFYRPDADEVHLIPKELWKSEVALYSCAAHEFVHSTLSPFRLNRREALGKRFGDKAYSAEERVAELGSLFLAMDLGLALDEEHVKNHAAYFISWAPDLLKDPGALMRAMSDADKCVNFIRETVCAYAESLGVEPLIQQPRAARPSVAKEEAVESAKPVAGAAPTEAPAVKPASAHGLAPKAPSKARAAALAL